MDAHEFFLSLTQSIRNTDRCFGHRAIAAYKLFMRLTTREGTRFIRLSENRWVGMDWTGFKNALYNSRNNRAFSHFYAVCVQLPLFFGFNFWSKITF